jgi:hypothetical protein
MFFRCSTWFAFATVASSGTSQSQHRSPWFVQPDELTRLIDTVSIGLLDNPSDLSESGAVFCLQV